MRGEEEGGMNEGVGRRGFEDERDQQEWEVRRGLGWVGGRKELHFLYTTIPAYSFLLVICIHSHSGPTENKCSDRRTKVKLRAHFVTYDIPTN